MPSDFLSRARHEAEFSGHSLRLAALLRIAYAESTSDPLRARLTLTHSLDECRYVARQDRQYLLEDARIIAAAIAPEIVTSIAVDRHDPSPSFSSGGVLKTMIDRGHYEAAYEFLTSYSDPRTFPFHFVNLLVPKLDQRRRLTVIRSSIAAWRQSRCQDFLWTLRYNWKELPGEEALAVTREVIDYVLTTEDAGINANLPGGVQFRSHRQRTLFDLLHILRESDLGLAQLLIETHDELAVAARRYPNGWDSIREELEAERAKQPVSAGAACHGGIVGAGAGRDLNYHMALVDAFKTKNFTAALKYAQDEYREDTSPDRPNYAPKYRWPSSWRFRTVLYQIGLALGESGSVYLELVPDADLRLLALIEFVTALQGLPQLPGVQNRQPYPAGKPLFRGGRVASIPPMPSREFPRDTMRTPDGTLIRCPKCNWLPPSDTRWPCNCGHRWNSFWTTGRCPACKHQWAITQCLHCGEVSAHRSWYVRE